MNYGLIYTIPFATLKNEPCIVEIEKEDFTGEATELIPGESPFTVEIEDNDFMYVPTRFSSANIRVVGSDYLQHLYSTAYQQYRVTLKRNGSITWCGFIKPELYTQDYSSNLFELEIECQSAMSTLEFIPYKQTGEEEKIFVSLWDLLKEAINKSNAQYSAVYIPYVYSKSESDYKAGTDNVLSEMTVSEQDFFDEDDKAMTYKEVLEEICKLLNWTCVDWRGELYFVDIDHQGNYRKYSSDLGTWENVSKSEVLNVQKTGFAGADHTMDLIPGYNKVTVKTSNYNVGDIFRYDDYSELDVVAQKDYTKDNGVCHKLFLKPDLLKLRAFEFDANAPGKLKEVGISPSMTADEINILYGAIPVRYCNYEVNDGKASIYNYNYIDAIQVRQTRKYGGNRYFQPGIPIISLKGSPSLYSDGALVITGSVKLCVSDSDMSPLYKDKSKTFNIAMQIRIGSKYYDFQEKGWFEVEKYPGRYGMKISNSDGDDYVELLKNKTLDMPYDSADGYVIPIDGLLAGDIEIIIFAPTGMYVDNKSICGYYLKDFKVSFCKKNNSSKEKDNSDRYYENIVNENYINELDEIEFKISSYNNDGACYSKVMIGDNYLTDNLYSAIEEKLIRPEEQLIRRIISRYSDTHIKLTQEIQETAKLTPITKLSDNFMVSKIFMNIGGSIDYKMCKFRCVMAEI